MAHLAYFDESVDDDFFVLATVLMHENDWSDNLDKVLALRRRARRRHGISVTKEIKAKHIRRGRGPLSHLGWSLERRGLLLNQLLRWQHRQLKTRVFAVAINKRKLANGRDAREVAWQYTLQRVDTFCRKYKPESSRVFLFPDAGHGYFIRKLVRKNRRHQIIPGRFGGTLARPMARIIEDPNDRQSHESLLVQLADWNAYAALRSQHVAPQVPSFATAWDELRDTVVTDVNMFTPPPNPPGIVLYPK